MSVSLVLASTPPCSPLQGCSFRGAGAPPMSAVTDVGPQEARGPASCPPPFPASPQSADRSPLPGVGQFLRPLPAFCVGCRYRMGPIRWQVECPQQPSKVDKWEVIVPHSQMGNQDQSDLATSTHPDIPGDFP